MNALMTIQIRVMSQQALAEMAKMSAAQKALMAQGAAGGAAAGMAGGLGAGMLALEKWGNKAQWAGRQLSYNFTMPLLLAGAAGAKFALDNEAAMTRLKKVYGTGARDAAFYKDEIVSLGKAFEMLSNQYGIAQDDVINIAADWTAAGASGLALAKATKLTMDTMILGEMDAKAATEALISIQAQYGLSTEELSKTIDTLNMVENQTGITMEGLITGFQRAAGVARSAGIDVEHLAAMLASLVPASGSASQAGNALKTMVSRLLSPTKEAAEVMGMMGINTAAMGWNSMNGVQRLEAMAKSFDKLTGPQKAIASATIASRFQINKFEVLMKDILNPVGYYQRALKSTADESVNFKQKTKELNEVLQSSPQQLKIIWTNLQNTMASVVVPMLPYIIALAAGFVSLINKFKELDPAVQKLILAGLLFVALLGPVLKYLGSLVTMVGYLGNGLAAVGRMLVWFVSRLLLINAVSFVAKNLRLIGIAAYAMMTALVNALGLQGAIIAFRTLMLSMLAAASHVFLNIIFAAGQLMLLLAARFLTSGPVLVAFAMLSNALAVIWGFGVGAVLAIQQAFIPAMLALWRALQVGLITLQTAFNTAMVTLWGFMQTALLTITRVFNLAMVALWGFMQMGITGMSLVFFRTLGIIWGVGEAALALGFRAFWFTIGAILGIGQRVITVAFMLFWNAIGLITVVGQNAILFATVAFSRMLGIIWGAGYAAVMTITTVFMFNMRVLWTVFMLSLNVIVSGGLRLLLVGVVRLGVMMLAALTGPWGIAIVVILLLLSTFRKQISAAWNGVVAWFQSAIPRIGEAFSPIVDFFGQATDSIKKAFWSLPAGVQGAFLTVVSIVRKAAMAVYDLFSYFNPFAKHSPSLVDNVKKGMTVVGKEHNTVGAVGTTMKQAASSVQSFKQVTGAVDAKRNNFSAPMVQATGDLQNFQNATSSISPTPFASQREDIAKVLPSALPSMDKLIGTLTSLNRVLASQKALVDDQQLTVDGWKKELDKANAAIDVQEKKLDKLKGNLDVLTASYDAHKTALEAYASAPLAGMKAVDDALFSNSMSQKRLELQILKTAKASTTASGTSKEELDALQKNVDSLTASLDAHKNALQGYVNAPLVGMRAMGDAIFSNSMAQKKLQLQILKMGDKGGESVDSLRNKYALLQGEIEKLNGTKNELRMAGAGSDILSTYDKQIGSLQGQQSAISIDSSPVSKLQLELEKLQHSAEIMELEAALKFDPLQRQISNLVDTTKELTFAEITAGITRENAAIAVLSPQLDTATLALDTAKKSMDKAAVATSKFEIELGKLQNKAQIMELEKSLRFDPLQRKIAQLVDTSKELTFDEITAGIGREKAAMAALEPQIAAATTAVANQQSVIDTMVVARDAISDRYDTETAKLAVLNDSYSVTEKKIRDIESALNDMGSAASTSLAKNKKDELSPAGQNFVNAGAADFPEVGGKSGIKREGGLGDQSKEIDAWMKANGGDISKSFGKIDMFKPIRDMWDSGWKWMEKNVGPVLGPLGSALKDSWNGLIEGAFKTDGWMSGITDGLGKTSGALSDWWDGSVKPIIDMFAPDLTNIWNAIWAAGEKIWNELLPEIGGAIKEIWPIVSAAFAVILGAIKVVLSVLGKVLGPAFDVIIDVVKSFFRVIKGVAEIIVGVFTLDGEKIWQGIKDVFGGIFVAIGSIIKNSVKIVWGLIEGLVGGIFGWFQWLWDILVGHSIIPDLINSIVQWFKDLGPWAIEHITAFITGAVDWFKKLPGMVWDGIITLKDKLGQVATDAFLEFYIKARWQWLVIKAYVSNFGDEIKEKAADIKDKFAEVATDAFKEFWIKARWEWLVIKAYVSNFGDEIKEKAAKVKDKFGEVATEAFNKFKEKAEGLWSGTRGILNWFGGLAASAWEKVKTIPGKISKTATDGFNNFKKSASDKWSGAKGILTWLGGLASSAWEKVKTIPGKIAKAASDGFNNFKKNASDRWTGAKGILTWLGGLASSAWEKVKTIPGKIAKSASDGFNNFKKSASDRWSGPKGILVWLGGLASSAWEKVKTIPGSLIRAATDAFTGFLTKAKAMWDGKKGIMTWVGTLASSIGTKLGDIGAVVAGAVAKAWNGAAKWINTNGIAGINKVTKFLGFRLGELPIIKGYAGGGVVPGGQSKKDNMLIGARSGEGVIVPEAVRAIGGAGGLNRLNSVAANGGDLLDFMKRTGIEGYATGGLIGFANKLKGMDFQVGEHPLFGGVSSTAHTTRSQHYNRSGPGGGGAIDVNHDGRGQAAETAAINSIVGMARSYGLRSIWQYPAHYDHVHFDIAGGADLGQKNNNSGTAPPIDTGGGWWDNLKSNAAGAWNAATGKIGDLTGAVAQWVKKGTGFALNKVMSPLGGLLKKSIPGDTMVEQYMAGMLDNWAAKAKTWGDARDKAGTGVNKSDTGTSVGVSGNNAANQIIGRDMAAKHGWIRSQWNALKELWTKESQWNQFADNPSSDAYGIPQSLPGSKMASSGADWRTNPATQIDWGLKYISQRYNSPVAAMAHSRKFNWYDDGGFMKPGMTTSYNASGKPEPVFSAAQWSTVRALVAASTNVLKSSGVAGVGSPTGLRGASLVTAQGRINRFSTSQSSQAQTGNTTKTELHFHGSLTFPNVKTGDDAKSFIRNLESLAG